MSDSTVFNGCIFAILIQDNVEHFISRFILMYRIYCSVYCFIHHLYLILIRNLILVFILTIINLYDILLIIRIDTQRIGFCKCKVFNWKLTAGSFYYISKFCILIFIIMNFFIAILIKMLDCIFLICFLPLCIKSYRSFHCKFRMCCIPGS